MSVLYVKKLFAYAFFSPIFGPCSAFMSENNTPQRQFSFFPSQLGSAFMLRNSPPTRVAAPSFVLSVSALVGVAVQEQSAAPSGFSSFCPPCQTQTGSNGIFLQCSTFSRFFSRCSSVL
jgi:hypothetical protein